MSGNLISRVQGLLLSPKAEWSKIDVEPAPVQPTYMSYIIPLAAIPAVAGLIGGSVFGYSFGTMTYRVPLGSGITTAILQFGLGLASVYVFAHIISWLAPKFGAAANFDSAFKVAAFAPTASWVSGAFLLVPALGIVALIGAIYSLYLLFVGLPALMKPAEGKGASYTLVALACAIVLGILASVALSVAAPRGPSFNAAVTGPGSASLGGGASQDAREAALEQAAREGDLGAILGALSGEEPGEPIAAEDLEGFAPMRLAGLERTELSTQSVSFPVQATVVSARYGDGDASLNVQITQSGAMAGMMGLSGVTGATYDRRTETGFERLKRDGGDMVIESWDGDARTGSVGRSVEGRLLVTVEGDGVEFDTIQKAADTLISKDLRRRVSQ